MQGRQIEETISAALAQYSVTEADIALMLEESKDLQIRDIDDTEGYALVHEARMAFKRKRVAVEKRRKELKADALAFGRAVDGRAKEITALLLQGEEPLAAEEKRIDDEKARIKAEAAERERKAREEEERKRQLEIQRRQDALGELGCNRPAFELAVMEPDDFEALLEEAREKFEARKALEEAEAAERKLEQDRIAAERRKLEEERAELEAERARVAAAKEEDEAEERRKQESKDAEERERAEAEKQKRLEAEAEARKPLQAKLGAFAEVVRGMNPPEGLPQELHEQVTDLLEDAADDIALLADRLPIEVGP